MDHVKMFTEEYGPLAVQVSKQTGIAPSVILAQWGMETEYGRKVPGQFNFGNIKDLSGAGTEAVDNKTKTKDRYLNFESPEAFADYYAHLLKRLYPKALNTGTDVEKLAEGLRSGVIGSYAQDENYEKVLKGAHQLTSRFFSDPKELPTVRPPTQAEEIAAEREVAGESPTPTSAAGSTTPSGLLGAAFGAAVSGPLQAAFRPEYAEEPPNLSSLKKQAQILEAEYRKSTPDLQQAQRELQRPVLGQQATAPKSIIELPTTRDIVVPSRSAMDQVLQGTIDPETGTTGRQRQGYNEITSFQKLQREQQEQALREARARGLAPDIGESARLKFGTPGTTPSGLIVKPGVAAVANQMEAQRVAQEQQRQEQFEKMTKAQDKLEKAKLEARAAPSAPARALQNIGVSAAKKSAYNPFGRTAIGALGGYQAETGANALAGMNVQQLVERWAAGDRSPELQQALIEAANAAGRTGAGVAASVPAMGPKTSRLKGAGVLGTLGLGALQAIKALQEPEKAP